MKTYKFALLTGDGIGPVMAQEVGGLLKALGGAHGFGCELETLPFGKAAYEKFGEVLPDSTASAILASDAALVAAVDAKGIPSPVSALCKKLGIFADVRPIKARPGRWALRDDLDMVMVREITQGFFSDRSLFAGGGEWMSDDETAFSLRLITYEASRNIADYAFKYAAANGRKKVTAAHKASIFKMTCGLFLKACRDSAKEYPAIEYDEEVADDIANRLISDPKRYDIVLTTNLFGDLLSDEAAALVSSLAPSVSEGANARVYMPISRAPAYAALEADSFDPMPALVCLSMMLNNIGEQSAAKALDAAINHTLQQGAMPASEQLKALGGRLN